ncbi:MAG: ROK family protein [Planctomycetia bacterium]|nr:ROK family protein [Planctomycetia bacterium]
MKKQILAVDIGGSKMIVGLVRVHERDGQWYHEIVHTVGEKLPTEITEEEILARIAHLTELLKSHVSLSEIDSIGVTIPGLADERVWIYAPFSGIQNFPITDALEKYFGKPVFIENDVNACAIAEGIFGACREVRDFIWLTISNGIGGGVVLDGHIYRGARGFSGEFGHINVVEDGELCGCGNRGCLEAECAGPGISRYYAHLTGEQVSAAEIAQRARSGEVAARETYEREGWILGRTLANAASILNPARILIGGGVVGAWDLFSPALETEFRKNMFRRANSDVIIQPTALGYEAALLGAVALTLK